MHTSKTDTERMDWLESAIQDVSWRNKSWLVRGDSVDLVPDKPGEKWPDGITQPTARAAIDQAMAKRRKK